MTPRDAIEALRARRPGPLRLYVAGGVGEPGALAEVYRDTPDLAEGVTFLGAWIPGMNEIDWAGFHETARAETQFLHPPLRPSFEAGRTVFRPMRYRRALDWFAETPLDAACAMVSPPDANSEVSFGVSVDFSPAVFARANVFKIALVNPAMPAPPDSPRLPLAAFDLVAETGAPLMQADHSDLPPVFARVAANVATLVEDGDTLQFGIGNMQQAVLAALTGRTSLRLHSGMVSDPVLGLLDAGAIEDAPGSILTGVAYGTDALYDRAREDPRFAFRPVDITHGLAALSAAPRLKAINSAIEVDLFGQANAEMLNTRQVSGVGGLLDFLEGAAASPGGRGVIALASTAGGGAVSRIVPRLAAPFVTLPRTTPLTVVTEHGVADLRDQTLDQRVQALIAVAEPAHRAALAAAWDETRRAM